MTRQPTTRAQGANGAAGADVRRSPADGGRTELGRFPAACLEALGRISDLHTSLASEVRALAQNLEEALAAGADLSVMSRVAADPPKPKSPLLTAAEMRALLKCTSRTLRRLELQKEIPAPIGKGRLKRWRRRDVDEWLAEGGRRR